MKNLTRLIVWGVVLTMAGLAGGCSSAKRDMPEVNQRVDVWLQATQVGSSDPGTKTFIGGEQLNKVYWSERDTISLYWSPSGNAGNLSGEQRFYCYQYAPSQATFAAQMEALTEGSYDYYAAFPRPASVEGTRATYQLPAEQDGTYDGQSGGPKASYTGNLDFMVAEPLMGQPGLSGDQTLAMQFVHQCHVMRIQVPTGRNQWGANIRKLRVEFPSAVVGDMTVDMANPDAAPTLATGGNVVTAILDQTFGESEEDASDGRYVWLFLCPGTITGEVRFTAYDENGYQSQSLSVSFDKTLEKGRVTPINLTIPNELPVTWIDFSIVGNNLGEEPQSFTVTAPEGATFRNGTNTQTFTVNDQNLYSLGFYNEYDGIDNGSAMRSGPMTITYDSEHAIVSEEQTLTAFTVEGHTPMSLTVPYLLAEDFSEASEADGENKTEVLDSYNLAGWSGSNYRISGNTGIRLSMYAGTISAFGAGDMKYGRLDSPYLSLKEGAEVTLSVLFDVGGTSTSGINSELYALYSFGKDTRTGAIDWENVIETELIKEQDPGTDGSYTHVPRHISQTLSATNKDRLSWRSYYRADRGFAGSITAKTVYVYLDNIRVSIVP